MNFLNIKKSYQLCFSVGIENIIEYENILFDRCITFYKYINNEYCHKIKNELFNSINIPTFLLYIELPILDKIKKF